MPFNRRDRIRLTATARRVAEAIGVPEEKRAEYVVAYVDAIEVLNDRVDQRIEAMEQEVTEITVSLLPGAPVAVQKFAANQVTSARSAVQAVTKTLAEFNHPGLMKAVAAALRDSLGYYVEAADAAVVAGDAVTGASRD